MTNPTHTLSPDDEALAPSRYSSFILRCWTGGGQVRARLIDVGSGASYPVTNLADLPKLVSGVLSRSLPKDAAGAQSERDLATSQSGEQGGKL